MSSIDALSSSNMPVTKTQGSVAKPSVAESAEQIKIRKAAKEFEGIFMDIVMKSMRSTVQGTDVFGSNEREKFFQTMLDSEYSKISSAKNGLGLADAIVKQFTQRQIASESFEKLRKAAASESVPSVDEWKVGL